MIDLFEARHADQPSLEVVGPAVVCAHEAGSVALLGAADRVAAMAASVHQNLRVAFGVADADHAILTDVGLEEIARLRDLGVVGDKVPGTGKDPFQFELIDVLVGKHAPVDRPRKGIDHLQHFVASIRGCHEVVPPFPGSAAVRQQGPI